MNRLFKYSVFLFFISQFLLSEIVDNNTISILSNNFISQKNTINVKYHILNIQIIEKNEQAQMYLVNLEPSGFILFSADNRLQPILGYSLDSNLDIENIPHHMQILLNGYHEQIQYAIENNIS